ncbi:MAG TPA: peptidylprolyl isomerase [Ilumatobacter sp.]
MTVALSGCSTFTNRDVVARVNGADITVDEFEPLAAEYFGTPEVFGATPVQYGRGDADQARPLATVLVQRELLDQFFEQQGVDATTARDQFKAEAIATSALGGLSDAMQDLITGIHETPRTQVLRSIEPPAADELRALYADDPARIGMLCMRHILVETEAEADAVIDELAGGADFATLALERSIDPTVADNAGALGSATNDCVPLKTLLPNFAPEFTRRALTAREGVPAEPVETQFGWHVILQRPWDEVAASVLGLYAPGDAGSYLFDGFAVTSSVTIDPRFGTWDQLTSTIVPIG